MNEFSLTFGVIRGSILGYADSRCHVSQPLTNKCLKTICLELWSDRSTRCPRKRIDMTDLPRPHSCHRTGHERPAEYYPRTSKRSHHPGRITASHPKAVFPAPGGPHSSVTCPRVMPPGGSLPTTCWRGEFTANALSSSASPVGMCTPASLASSSNAAEALTVGRRSGSLFVSFKEENGRVRGLT